VAELVHAQDEKEGNGELQSIGETTSAQGPSSSREDRAAENGGGDEGQSEQEKMEERVLRDPPAPLPVPLRRGRERFGRRKTLVRIHAWLISGGRSAPAVGFKGGGI
jgi:hypothetical protein